MQAVSDAAVNTEKKLESQLNNQPHKLTHRMYTQFVYKLGNSVFLFEFISNSIPSNSRLVEHFQDLLPSIRGFISYTVCIDDNILVMIRPWQIMLA